VKDVGWVAAKDLSAGSQLETKGESWLGVDRVEQHTEVATVYNFEVAGFHTYFVSDLGLLVHNSCPVDVNVRHIFHGEINRRGNAVGFHHEGSIGSQNYGRIVPGTQTPTNSQGVYKASVEIFDKSTGTWVPKGPQSSFFPKQWSRAEVLNETRGAFQNQTVTRGNYWEGISPSGTTIGGYLDRSGNINTAFPIY
jgi:Bacterial EndoU nuclease/Pretoxin HINT domain